MNGMICLVNCTELHYVMGIQSFISCQIVRDVMFFCYAWKTLIMDACSCVHMYLQSLQIFPWSCFLKEKIILLSKESSLLEKKKNIYCAFPDMKEIIIKKSVKTGETASRIINFVYSFIPKIQSGVLCLFHRA